MKKAAERIVKKLRLRGHEAFFAGGWVRDFLLRRKPKDIDIATSALPNEVLHIFPKSRDIGAHFGVIQVQMFGHEFEVTTFRNDHTYLDGRHPSSVTFCGPEQDALRRDFSINGLFYDPISNRLIDYVHGKIDIQNKLIRTIGDPHLRLSEDKLRMLRAIRFSCNLGFTILPDTWEAIQSLAFSILQVSWERIRDELIGIFTGPAPGTGLDMLYRSGLLGHILPEVASLHGIQQSTNAHADIFIHTRDALSLLHKPSAVLAIGTLLHDVGKSIIPSTDASEIPDTHAQAGAKISEAICRRLRISGQETDQIVDLVLRHSDFEELQDMRKGSWMRLLHSPNFDDHLKLLRANLLSNHRNLTIHANWMRKLAEFGRIPHLPIIHGEDLIKMGYTPGPIFKEILQTIEDFQYEGTIRTREDAIQHIRSMYPLADNPDK
jgi:tRNA nucleotidyltransferase/poly(A) polymerase